MRHFFAFLVLTLLSGWLNLASAQEPNYILGPGDVLKINVYSNPDLSLEARVSEAGLISYPLIGQVMVGGLTTFAAEKRIAGLLESRGFIKEPQVNVLVMQFQSKLVSVLGSVYKPGRYPIERTTNLADLLAQVGGATPDGSDLITVTTATGKKEYDLHKIVNQPDGLKAVSYTHLSASSSLSSYQTLDNSYTRLNSLSISPLYAVSDKITMRATAAITKRTFLGEGVIPDGDRVDWSKTASFGVDWSPLRTISIGGSLERSSRDSNIDVYDYNDTTVGVNANLAI